MHHNTMRAALLASSMISGAALFAFSATSARAADAAASADTSSTSVGEVVVTGSRIPRPNLDQPTPISVLTPQLLQDSGAPALGDAIAQLPALSAQGTQRSNSNSFGNAGGLDFADLRNLGPNRTLVLVDGKRHVAGDPTSAAVDLSSIPPALVDRVEIVTGGASAIYGSDALAGVVNIILKKRFDGFEFNAQGGVLEPGGGGANYSANATWGHNFPDNRGNIAITALWDRNEGVVAHDIRSLHNYGTIINPLDTGPNDGIPDKLIVPNVLSEFIDENTVLLDPNTFQPITAFTNAGQPVPQQQRLQSNSFAFGNFAGPCPTCFALEDYLVIIPKSQRYGVAANLDYQLNSFLHATLDAKYIRNEVHDFVQPSFTFGDFQLHPDNAFITPAIQNVLAGLTPPNFPLIARFMSDFGNRTNDITRETYRIVGGLDGKVDAQFADVTWDASINYGTTRNHIIAGGSRIKGNFQAALDSVIDPATGKPACRINVPSAQPLGFTPPAGVLNGASCVPYNPFGQQNTAAAIAYSTVRTHEFQAIEQTVADLNLSFDSSRFFKLPGGPVSVAAGAEYRSEKSADVQDPLIISGVTENAPTPNASGGFEVYEGYVEVNAPIFKHRFLADELSLDGAYRIAEYSTVGTANAWKVSGVYGPFPGLKFRGTYSEAVRAPNITEAFLPPSGTFFTVSDPCDNANVGVNVNRPANCKALIGVSSFNSQTNVSPPGTVSGNLNLTPEKSTSYTLGLVAQPPQIPGLGLTIDYYHININNAITLVAAQDILNNCVDSSTGPDPAFCNLVTRDPVTHNITFIKSTYVNAAALQTEGVETQLTYSTNVAPLTEKMGAHFLDGRFTLSADVNYLIKLHQFPFQANPKQVHILERDIGFPQWRGLVAFNYSQGPWAFDWQVRYVGRSVRFIQDPSQADFAEQLSPAFVGEQFYNNLVVHFRPVMAHGRLDFFVGANDIFDVQPPIAVIAGNPTGADGSALYDLGRYVFGGVKADF